MIRSLKFAAFTVVCAALLAAPAFGAKGGTTATITFANSGSTLRTTATTAGSSVSFAVTASVRAADVYSLWVSNVCSVNGVTVSAEYQPVLNWTSGPFKAQGTSCKASVVVFPDVWTALKGGTMTYAVS